MKIKNHKQILLLQSYTGLYVFVPEVSLHQEVIGLDDHLQRLKESFSFYGISNYNAEKLLNSKKLNEGNNFLRNHKSFLKLGY